MNIGLVAERNAVVAIDPHGTVAMVAVERSARRVQRDQMVVDAETELSDMPAKDVISFWRTHGQ